MGSFEEELRQLSKRNEEKFQEAIRKITGYIPVMIALGIAVWWLFYGAIKVSPTKLELVPRIGLTAFTLILSMMFRELIANGGYDSAKLTETYITSQSNYEKAVFKGLSKQKQIVTYANGIAIDNLNMWRKSNLECNGLSYNEFFDKNGNYIGGDYKRSKKLKKHQKKVIKKCLNQRIVLPSIFGFISSKWFGFKKEVSQKKYKAKTTAKNFVFSAIVSFVGVGITFEFIGFSVSSLIYAFFQIILWASSGFIQRINNFNFILDNIVPLYDEKTHIINSYFALSESEKRKYEPIESEVINNA
jgi:hypothetical protein